MRQTDCLASVNIGGGRGGAGGSSRRHCAPVPGAGSTVGARSRLGRVARPRCARAAANPEARSAPRQGLHAGAPLVTSKPSEPREMIDWLLPWASRGGVTT